MDRAKALENEKAACEKQVAGRQAEILRTQQDLADQKDRMARADQQAALGLVKKLGRGAVARPLSWPSVFDLIVVTGHQR